MLVACASAGRTAPPAVVSCSLCCAYSYGMGLAAQNYLLMRRYADLRTVVNMNMNIYMYIYIHTSRTKYPTPPIHPMYGGGAGMGWGGVGGGGVGVFGLPGVYMYVWDAAK